MASSTGTIYALLVAGAALAGCNDDRGESTDGFPDATSTGTTTGEASSDNATTTADDTTGAGATSETTTGGEPLTRVEKILAALDVAMYQCPERSWPDVAANYRSRQVLLAAKSDNRAWVWNYQDGSGEPPEVHEGVLDTLPPEWAAYFNTGKLGSAVTLSISLDATQGSNDTIVNSGGTPWPDYATSLAFHEGFHFLSDQDDWDAGEGSRSAPYPEPWEPRYLRAQQQRALLAEVENEGMGLQAAAYWHSRLTGEYADEMNAIRSYDCTEGSAEYVSLMMSAIAELGCEASDAEILALAISHVPDGQFVGPLNFDGAREPYDLGVLAGLLLRRAGVAGWELAVEKGAAPADQLLAGVTAVPQPDDPAVQAAAQAAVKARNEVVGAQIEPMLAHMKDPDYTRIAVSFEWIAGSFRIGGFYYLADDPKLADVFVGFSAMLKPPSQTTIDVSELTLMVGSATPCALTGPTAMVLTVPTADLALHDGTATATNARVAFTDLAVEPTSGPDNLPWLCPVDAGGANGAPAPQPGLGLHTVRTIGEGPTQVLVRRTAGRASARWMGDLARNLRDLAQIP